MTLNCRSLRGKTAHLKVILADYDVDIIVLQETWLNKGDASLYTEFLEMDFKIVKLERDNKRGGGLALFVKCTILLNNKISTHNVFKCNEFDALVCSFKVGRNCFNIVNIYRQPSKSKSLFLKEFDAFLAHILEISGYWIILGDFNIDLLSTDHVAVEFSKLLQKYSLVQMVRTPTREKSLLDFVIVQSSYLDESTMLDNSEMDFPSDHTSQLVEVKLQFSASATTNHTVREIRNYSSVDDNTLRSAIEHSPLTDINLFSNLNSHECVNLYNKEIEDIVNKVYPKQVKIFRHDRSKRWFNDSLSQLKKEKRRAERAFRKSNKSEICRLDYIKIKNNYTTELKKARASFYSAQIQKCKNDPKSLYKILNELTGNKKARITPTNEPEIITAEQMSDFYVEKVLNIRQSINAEGSPDEPLMKHDKVTTRKHPSSSVFADFREINVNELKEILSSLNKKSCAIDPAPAFILGKCFDLLYPIFLKIVNSSIFHCEFPNPLKHAIVTPILKGSSLDPETFKNYRPVSSLPFVAKLVEKSLHVQLNNYIEGYNLYPQFQSSYRQHHSCETSLTKLIDVIQDSLFNGKNVALILLDSSAAFDTVDQHRLITKLERNFGIKGNALKLINSYFQHRTFSTTINNTHSSPRELLHGVPQGSLLGPLFYVLYTHEIEEIVLKYGLSIQTYADDCQIYASFYDNEKEEIERLIKHCLDEIQSWMKANFLKLNAEKTVVKLFRHKKSLLTDFNSIGETTEGPIKILGASINDVWNYNEFISKKVQTCNFHLRNLCNIKDCLDVPTRILLVTNLILSTVDYCNILLLGATDLALRPLRLVINKAIRFIYNLKIRQHITPYYKRTHFLPIQQRIKFEASLIAYKIFNGQAPK